MREQVYKINTTITNEVLIKFYTSDFQQITEIQSDISIQTRHFSYTIQRIE